MKMEPPQKLLELVTEISKRYGTNGPVHINMPYICDSCQDKNKDAYPYHVKDRTGKFWADLCNECFDLLGCSYGIKLDYENLGREIHFFRLEAGLSQQNLASLSGVSRNYIGLIERGKVKNISIEILVKLANALDEEVITLFNALVI